MDERLSEAELQDIEADAGFNPESQTLASRSDIAEDTLRLVAEVRRLRALILLAGDIQDIDMEFGTCNSCGKEIVSGTPHDPGCPLLSLQDEAQSITREATDEQ